MQDYFVSNTFKDDPDALLKLSFVGTCCLVAANSMGPAAQIVASRFGVRVVMACGGLLVVLGLELAGSATQIWHLYLTQGILFGSGASILYVTIMAVAPQYFTRRRGVAIGLITSGSGIGGVIIPFIMTPINASLGYPWTYRVLGLLCLICSTIATIVVRDRIPKPREKKRFSDIIKFEILKDPNYILWCLGSAVMLMGYFIPFFYLPKYATDLGLTPTQGSSLVAIASACNSIGRIMSGAAADKIGPLNVDVIFSIIGGLSSLLIWRFAYSFSVLVAFSVIFGLFCGSYFALVSTITAAILGPEKFCSGLSFILISNTVSVFAPNIANALELNIGAEPSLVYKIFSGVTYIVGALIIFILKMRINRDIFAKV
ncbi:major facilitator superfamily domain-containing protein [Spinellus fusiger]|nr:major facilitator superfamily domain-containing protein [Spinellus fusiger]